MAAPFSFAPASGANTVPIFGSSGTTSLNTASTPAFGTSTGTTVSSGIGQFGASSTPGAAVTFGAANKVGGGGFGQPAPAVSAIPQKVNSRCSVRLLTQLIPQWRGHFDVADLLLTAHEKNIAKVRPMVDRLVELDAQCWQSHDEIKNSLNGISLLQTKLQHEVNDRCKRQDAQNLLSIKARRLSESLRPNETPRGSKISAMFRVPNHLHVQLTKELLDNIRSWRNEIHVLNMEVLSLKDIDLSQYVTTVNRVLSSHEKRISTIGDRLTKALRGMDDKSRNREELWSGVADEPSELKKAFLTAVGLPIRPPASEGEPIATSSSDTGNEIKKQIAYLRKFNTAFRETGSYNLDQSGYNIREILQQPTQPPTNSQLFGATQPSTGLFGAGTAGSTTTPLFGGSTANSGGLFGNTGGSNLFGAASKPAGTTNVFGSTAGTTGSTLFGGSTTAATGTNVFAPGGTGTNVFAPAGTGTNVFAPGSTGTNVFAPGGTGTNVFAPAGTGTNVFAPGGAGTNVFAPAGTGTNAFAPGATGAPNVFGGAATGTSGTPNVFGAGATGTSTTTGIFGAGSTPTFGQQQQPNTTGNVFGQQPASSGGLFGQQQPSTSGGLFGQQTNTTGGLFGQQQPAASGGLFRPQQQQQGATGGLFGQQPTTGTGLFGQQQPATTTNVFAQQPGTTTGGLFGNTTTTQPSTTFTFGQQQQTPATGNVFGQQQQPNTTGTVFGQQQQTPATGNVFGQQPGTTGGGLFGGAGNSTSLFGQQNTGGLFGQSTSTATPTQPSKSTAIVPYNPNPLLR
ncbi:Nucleoporin NUP116/NSP116 [Babesia bigemina]|uniref:Nucleoporin NUP116/NSP116 n=1 Tax=Babesia bigemina TaxID=5866 RepID=A0A061D860_BABBI|nr:Nucleoporin NUP116/NSP116 [Babesia bigemina]CDR96861.1 Nucleoporin NUP116/NSP116 [Babesia bigemina]|eukprot:XP_012769047.1 Nucleoporin NUP116/NSP116 [Babesia bigemina]